LRMTPVLMTIPSRGAIGEDYPARPRMFFDQTQLRAE